MDKSTQEKLELRNMVYALDAIKRIRYEIEAAAPRIEDMNVRAAAKLRLARDNVLEAERLQAENIAVRMTNNGQTNFEGWEV